MPYMKQKSEAKKVQEKKKNHWKKNRKGNRKKTHILKKKNLTSGEKEKEDLIL